MTEPNINDIKQYFMNLQDIICQGLAAEDSKSQFKEEQWVHQHGGGGRTRILTNGDVFESAGVNFSHVKGPSLPRSATQLRPELEGRQFEATGVSIVIHPNNPYVPTSHANVRFFMATKEGSAPIWWFGGGLDLTPYYGYTEDCIHWHEAAYKACLPYGSGTYEKYKRACDQYFYLKHRKEPRGIGGLFFDDLNEWGFLKSFAFTQAIGDLFLRAYQPIVAKRKSMPFSEKQKAFQCYRRGRYVEFNLIYDRGTLFGLQSGGAVDSILMSMPPEASWRYKWQPEPGSHEQALYDEFLVERDWLGQEVMTVS